MGAFRLFVFSVVAIWLGCGSALAEKRVALVIGNSGYDNVAKVSNSVNDASLMADTFKAAGFDIVDLRRNLKIAEMRRALRDFVDKSQDADIAVVYYAGHGIEVDGVNYLVPVDAVLERDIDIYDEALSLDRVLVSIEPARQLRLVILDACRDNPFTRSMKRTVASRAIGRGLAKVEPTSPNTLIAFASKAGSTASDGDGKNSPFTMALVKHLAKPGLDLRKAFGYVRDDVLKATSNKQEPYVYGSLGGDDVPLVPAKPSAAAIGPQADPQVAVRRDYELALQLATRDGWEAFLSQYPDGFYANLAKGQLKKIAAEDARTAAVEKARAAEQEKARLAAEGAKQAEQARAAAAAKAAEEARLAAEKAKQIELAKAAAAEQARALAEKAAAEKKAVDAAAAELAARQAAEKQMAGNKSSDDTKKVASLSPPSGAALSPTELITSMQLELRRVGCLAALANGEWSETSRRSLTLFNKYAGTKFDVRLASLDALEAVKAKPDRVCPLVCEFGYKPDGDQCVKIVCDPGFALNDNNECAKNRETPTRQERATKRNEPKPVQPQTYDPYDKNRIITAGGLRTCGGNGCQIVPKGCRAIRNMGGGGLGGKIVCP